MDHVVVDVEIAKTIEETPGGWDSTDQLGIGVAVVYEFQSDRFRVFGPNDVEALRARLLKADRISGFNTFNFDFPVIFGHSRFEWKDADASRGSAASGLTVTDVVRPVLELKEHLRKKSNDILRRIWQSQGLDPDNFDFCTHGGFKLDVVAQQTIGIGKIGNGADAPKWFQSGQFHKLIEYCIDDVTIERDLAVFVDKYGYVIGERGRRLYLK